jgi:hypothetical protein
MGAGATGCWIHGIEFDVRVRQSLSPIWLGLIPTFHGLFICLVESGFMLLEVDVHENNVNEYIRCPKSFGFVSKIQFASRQSIDSATAHAMN